VEGGTACLRRTLAGLERYRRLTDAAEGGRLDLYDADGNLIPGPNKGGEVIPSVTKVKQHLAERDTTEFDRYFDQ
jgi:hypothetical protein